VLWVLVWLSVVELLRLILFRLPCLWLLFSAWGRLWLLARGVRWLRTDLLLGRAIVGPFAPEVTQRECGLLSGLTTGHEHVEKLLVVRVCAEIGQRFLC
jgi:hypothetical protein